MSFKEHTHSNDNLAINVKRHDKKSRFTNLFGGGNKPRTIETSVFGDGFLTAQVRRYNPETQSHGHWNYICKDKHNLLTNAGRDYFHQQCYKDTGLNAAGTAWIAVTTTAVTPAAGDTTLSGEMTTLGFSRALGVYAHSAGTNATTLTYTFTATGPATNVQASALFNQLAVGGTMSHEATFTPTTFATNDQLQITWTLNLG